MKVGELMTTPAETCHTGTNLTDAAMMMWRRDCGMVPVVHDNGKVAGVITDRDICIATATRHQRPEEIETGQVMRTEVFTCRPDEDVRDALETMRQHQVRRLPVVDATESVIGVLSLSDVVRRAEPVGTKGSVGVPSEDVLAVYKAVSAPRTVFDVELLTANREPVARTAVRVRQTAR